MYRTNWKLAEEHRKTPKVVNPEEDRQFLLKKSWQVAGPGHFTILRRIEVQIGMKNFSRTRKNVNS